MIIKAAARFQRPAVDARLSAGDDFFAHAADPGNTPLPRLSARGYRHREPVALLRRALVGKADLVGKYDRTHLFSN